MNSMGAGAEVSGTCEMNVYTADVEVGILFCLCAKSCREGFPTHPQMMIIVCAMPIWPNDTIDRS